MEPTNTIRKLKYIHIGGRSLECGKIINVYKNKTFFRKKPSLDVVYDGRDELFGTSFFFASLSSTATLHRFRYNDTQTRDNMYSLMEKIILDQHDLQNELLKPIE